MFNSGIADVAIGLIFIYLLLSLICSAVNEILESWLKMRARDLERGIRELLGDPGMVKKLYDHPLISGLFKGSYEPAKVSEKTGCYATASNLPSYIPSRNFALALMDLALPASSASTQAPVASGAAGATASRPLMTTVSSAASSAQPSQSVRSSLQPLRDALGAMPDLAWKKAMLPLMDAAAGDADQARDNIERWYNSTMDRVSGWYRRRIQWIVLALGLAVVVLANVDTLTIGNSLSHDVSMRDALVAAAHEYAKANSSAEILPSDADKIDACKKNQNSPECRVTRNLSELERLGLPVGWRVGDIRSIPETASGWLTKVVGWLITAAAISLGAPFWFDVLNRFMVVRSTVKPREKSPDEPPVDK